MFIKIKKLHENAIIPQYQTAQSAGFDLHALESSELKAGERALVATGLAFEIEEGYEVQVRPRSGLALKNGISVLNTPGTVDSDYRGEIKIILVNFSNEDFTINAGDRIAQAVVSKVYQAEFEIVEILSDTERGSGGFGSSGVKKEGNYQK
ncbi:dUTP diphosphatase [Helicobacter sp. MIT 00-7814]|uniref:dUTP diphosphatase n=1 Tax=unclassified Helicobacter TaxID=2593540 RepID=UPI000E1E4B9E|nr:MULTISPECIES: dUTP diphosphatase [unclassified Helicobacter]RDU51891.1 dUTP diphosphatase [Helicobacter sp. MIT 00-7814]RDU54054.1 dUTP diphosphatase [Helicobacter sp. MIT 99-10781]